MKDNLEDASWKMTYIAAGLAVASVLSGGTAAVVYGVGSVAFGLLAYETDRAAGRGVDPDYRGAGAVPPRPVQWPGQLTGKPWVEQAVAAEAAGRTYTSLLNATFGAMAATDVEWTERHLAAAGGAYVKLGQALAGLTGADGRFLAEPLALVESGPPTDPAAALAGLLARVRPVLGLSGADERHLTERLLGPLAAGSYSTDATRDAVAALRRLGERMAAPETTLARVSFLAKPVASAGRHARGAGSPPLRRSPGGR